MLPRSRSNRVVIDGHRYRYVVSEVGSQRGTKVSLSITVQHEGNGAYLRVTGLTTSRVREEQSKFWMGRTVKPNIQPRHVLYLVGLALSRGWAPASPGPAFILQADNSDVFRAVDEA